MKTNSGRPRREALLDRLLSSIPLTGAVPKGELPLLIDLSDRDMLRENARRPDDMWSDVHRCRRNRQVGKLLVDLLSAGKLTARSADENVAGPNRREYCADDLMFASAATGSYALRL